MPDISIIGKDIARYGKQLRQQGYKVKTLSSNEAFLAFDKLPGLVLIDNSTTGKIRELKAATIHIPKIIIFTGQDAPRKVSWAKEPHAYMINNPSEPEVVALAKRAIAEAEAISASRSMSRTIETLKAELAFFEDMNRMMSLSSDINDIMPTVMKQARKITGAESWTVHFIDEETGELTCNRAYGRLCKTCATTVSSVATWNITNKKPLLIENIATDRKFGAKAHKSCKNRCVSIIATPIQGKTSTIGTIELLKNRTPFIEEDLDFLCKLAGRAALAIERIRLQQRLEELVVTDDLTNLFNTRYLTRSIENEIMRSARYGLAVAVIFMDIDHFKDVNDTYGHLAGSKVLVEIGDILIRELRNIDIVARYGGDEFVLVLPQTNLKNALAIAERIRESIEKNTFLRTERLNLNLTASFGVAAYPETASNKEDMMRMADESMYNVKRNTRNGVYAIIH